MNLVRLTRHSDNQLYAGAVKVVIKNRLGQHKISLNAFSVRDLEKSILGKTAALKANAYEPLKADLEGESGKYSGIFHFYRINKSALARERARMMREGQLEYSA
jgi:hypothetical protein